MSGESRLHVRLVESLERQIMRRHDGGSSILILLDHDRYGRDRPHRCNGFTPDLFASDLPATFTIIGEAKTLPDLRTERSAAQLRAFLDHLIWTQNGRLFLCVPFPAIGEAHALLRRLRGQEHEAVITEVLSLE